MGRRSSDTEEESRSKRKKKHRRRSSSSSSSDSRTYSRKKSGRKSRSRSRDLQFHSHSYEKRHRHRSSSSSSYGSKRKRSRSRSRDRGKLYRSQRSRSKSRTRRSHSRPQQRSYSRSSERTSHRRTRSRSRDKERRKGRDKEKTREKDRARGKEKDQHYTQSGDAGNIKAGLEHLSAAEQAKARLQLVLEAAAKADEALKAKERSEEEAKKKKEEGGQDRYSSGSASNLHTTPSVCLNSDLEGPPQEAYTIQGQYAIPQPDLTKLQQLAMQQSHFPMSHGNTGFHGLDASAQTISHELTIPNDLIGCIIGRQGAKINEIRQMSGAQIKIANPVEGSTDRQVTITGSAASISLAQYLINIRLSLETGGMGSI
ncbi:serine/Arginine-related protein 53 isoform X1 [Podarcis raffonei]|uniref:serine/Arginine-related protein 53 isoform X1 n=1 Tax=Podarcis raffonei TaxID=65483 RepID=UPI002329428D|nr:serine/Arginine-related protein 53 isoform X1 [Podarcis raffonei]XP_053246344.1 serine/Arginine-related protein 53 isoform X1 [Podarcis raffonei]